jgi:hypothetical protein
MTEIRPNEVQGDVPQSQPDFILNQEIAEKYLSDLERYPLSKRICICGHTVKSHRLVPSRGYSCEPGNVWCYCPKPLEVYFASDARCFSRATHGVGMKHALGLGIADLKRKKKTGHWLIPIGCWVQGCQESDITVACLTNEGFVTNKSTSQSALICRKHVLDFGGSLL